MQKSKKTHEPLPEEFASIKEAAEFWDKHDLSEYWDQLREVEFDIEVPSVPCYIPLEKDTADIVSKIAKKKHVSPETLVNLWIKEHLFRLSKQN